MHTERADMLEPGQLLLNLTDDGEHGYIPGSSYIPEDRIDEVADKISKELKRRLRAGLIIAALFLAAPAHAQIAETEIPGLVNIIIKAESSGRPHAIGDKGRSRGLMQIQKPTWRRYTGLSFDRAFDADLNRKIGEKHVRSIIERYGRKASRALVIYTYNTGKFCKGKLPAWTKKHPNDTYRRVFKEEVR